MKLTLRERVALVALRLIGQGFKRPEIIRVNMVIPTPETVTIDVAFQAPEIRDVRLG